MIYPYEIKPFHCDPNCGGLCCTHVGHIPELPSTDGVCNHLIDGKCGIYNQRPLVCRVDAMYDAGKFSDISYSEYALVNSTLCLSFKNKVQAVR